MRVLYSHYLLQSYEGGVLKMYKKTPEQKKKKQKT